MKTICYECDKSYTELQLLPGEVDLCPQCFERKLNGEL
ncbi:MAG: hypothetical protein J07HQW1_02314 [Haloquadratum walsbyi J07HQW1]|jgi:Zn-finger nucleic acid-binding protein|uniref:Uncharacterized protein n=1 Tax=Haloquadratum walsbyi J07HQW1 TaxID=1238424 RepID=U1MQG5_9EURY|nr:MAG: hypothetical protein J07HQW1_02314 [Haloquadratum walsbyi J07HQW1]